MPPLQVSTPNDTTIVLTRTFKAPRRLVWEAMTEPARMRRWLMPPPGFTTKICECEARVGGVLRIVSRTPEADPAMMILGVFTEAVAPERMVHTELMMSGAGDLIGSLVETHEFAEKNGVTSMRITQAYPSKEARDGGLAGQVEGLEACYVQLDAALAQAL